MGTFLKMRVSEIRVKRIRVNQGLGVLNVIELKLKCLNCDTSNFNTFLYKYFGRNFQLKINTI